MFLFAQEKQSIAVTSETVYTEIQEWTQQQHVLYLTKASSLITRETLFSLHTAQYRKEKHPKAIAFLFEPFLFPTVKKYYRM